MADMPAVAKALLIAAAKANGHPDPQGWADSVASYYEAPAKPDAEQAANVQESQ